MTIVPYEESIHYPLFQIWWNERNTWIVSPEYLPDFGLVVEDVNGPVCGGFLVETDRKICFIEHIVGDPKVDHEFRGRALDFLILALAQFAEQKGYTLCASASNRPRLIERFTKLGFVTYDKNVVHVGKKLGR